MPRGPRQSEGYDESLDGVGWRVLAQLPATKIVLYRLEPNHQVVMHSHPESEYGVMLAGTATHTMLLTTEEGGRRRVRTANLELKRGDCIIVPSGVPHAYVSGPKGESIILGVILSEDGGPLSARAATGPTPGVSIVASAGSRSRRLTGPRARARPRSSRKAGA
jgi:quercetin dioxygenase-like cupin family protein